MRPTSKTKFKGFPTPRSLKSKKRVRARETKKPLFVLEKMVDKVNKRAKKIKTMKMGTRKGVCGSVKYINNPADNHRATIARSVEK